MDAISLHAKDASALALSILVPDQAIHQDMTLALAEFRQSLQAPISKDGPTFSFLKLQQNQWRDVFGRMLPRNQINPRPAS